MSETNPSNPSNLSEGKSSEPRIYEAESQGIPIVINCKIDLALLRKQKRALLGVYEGAQISYEQEDAAEGLLNLIDFIQDSILEQGLATEEEVFPRPPQLFEQQPN